MDLLNYEKTGNWQLATEKFELYELKIFTNEDRNSSVAFFG